MLCALILKSNEKTYTYNFKNGNYMDEVSFKYLGVILREEDREENEKILIGDTNCNLKTIRAQMPSSSK